MLALFSILSGALLVGIDQLTKWWASTVLLKEGFISVIPGVFEFRYCENTGVAFSLLENQQWFFIPLSLLVTVFILVVLFRSPMNRYKTFMVTCVLIIAGAIGNLVDRIAYGYVIDFLYFRLINFPIFNFADCCVSVGAVLLFVFVLFIYKDAEDLPLRTLLFNIRKKEKPHDGE